MIQKAQKNPVPLLRQRGGKSLDRNIARNIAVTRNKARVLFYLILERGKERIFNFSSVANFLKVKNVSIV